MLKMCFGTFPLLSTFISISYTFSFAFSLLRDSSLIQVDLLLKYLVFLYNGIGLFLSFQYGFVGFF